MFNFNKSKKILVLIGFFGLFQNSLAGSYDDFFRAIKIDNVKEVQSLLKRGFDPNTLDERAQPGLLIALKEGSLKSAEVLIRAEQTRIELRNPQDESALMMAAFRGHKALVELLIWREADVNKTGWTPLHYAASGGHADVAKVLLAESAFIDAESANGTTPLMMAAMYGSADVLKLLLQEGADASLKNHLGMNALDFARQASRKDAIEILQFLSKPLGPSNKPSETKVQGVQPSEVPSKPSAGRW